MIYQVNKKALHSSRKLPNLYNVSAKTKARAIAGISADINFFAPDPFTNVYI
jgi:hypothetical protein